MSFWEQFLLLEATAGLHAIIAKFASKYYNPEEQNVLAGAGDLLGQLHQRIAEGGPTPKI